MKNTYKMKTLPKGEQPDEKALRFGIGALSDAELLSVIIRSGCTGRSALQTSYEILDRLEGIGGLTELSPERIHQIKGIGRVKTLQLAAIAELSRRIWKEQRESFLSFEDSGSIYRYYREQMRHLQQEEVWLLLLDNRLQRLKDVAVSKGTVNRSLVSPRDVFRLALSHKAVCFVLMHNHPSGDVTPSKDDITLTDHLISLGKMLELPLVDHIIFGESRYYSFRDSYPERF